MKLLGDKNILKIHSTYLDNDNMISRNWSLRISESEQKVEIIIILNLVRWQLIYYYF